MPTGRTDELTRRFGDDIAATISKIYGDLVEAASRDRAANMLSTEMRLAVVQAPIDEADNGRTDESHLRDVAAIFFPPQTSTQHGERRSSPALA